jgi:glutathione synthase/RimK-type ligase-like ATP-grasp enzyme
MKSASKHPRVAIASCADFAGKEKEDLQVLAALQERGLTTTHAAWDDSSVDWTSFDLVVVRSTWDYPGRLPAFLDWASRLPRVLNSFSILKWNTDKHYLNDFAKADVPVIPTQFLEPGAPFNLPAQPYVIKPAVSCGARDTTRYFPDQEAAARKHVQRLHAAGRTAMLQPYFADIERTGEVSIIYIGGTYSHAICRGALLNVPESAGARSWDPDNARLYEPTIVERLLANRVMNHVPGGPARVLYARIDIIPGAAGEPTLLELELTEPTLFLDYCPGSAWRLAEAIARAVQHPDNYQTPASDGRIVPGPKDIASPGGNGFQHHDG